MEHVGARACSVILTLLVALLGALLVALLVALLGGCSVRPAPEDRASRGGELEIAYVAKVGSNYEIFLARDDGSSPRNLTQNPASDFWLCWSPDGERIAFGSDRSGNNEIHVMDRDGGNCVNLTKHPASDKAPHWSPDGASILFHSTRDHARGEIYVMDADGSNVRRLTTNEEYEECAAWSPDGLRIAYCRLMPSAPAHSKDNNGEIYVMNRDGTGKTRLTNRPGFDSAPSWSPDGTRIAFHGTGGEQVDIYVVALDGSGVVNLTRDATENWQPSWSSDGSSIAYCGGVPPQEYDIWIMRTDGREKRRLTTAPGREQSPCIRPQRR